MEKKALYQKYAKLIVRRGVNVQQGQPVVIRAAVQNYEFVRMLVQEAYEAGASRVEIDWRDESITKAEYAYRSEEQLANIPDWMVERQALRVQDRFCLISLVSDTPGYLKEVNGLKLQAYSSAYSKKMKPYSHYLNNNEGQWCVAGYPTVEWAKILFPEEEEQAAFEKLEDAIFMTSRVDEESDPLQNWKEHDAELIAHADTLNRYGFQALHFTSELGTDLTVELVKNHVWVGGGDATPEGVYFDPNIPTEEVFCMPYKYGVNGVVYASKPLSYQGTVIENFHLRFENGKVVEHHAEKEEEALTNLLNFDAGSRYLGEVALVPYDSPISQLGFLFFNTLYDENAACHLALGQAYPENMQNGVRMSEEELIANGMNDSLQHEDFMFGTKHMHVDGILPDGSVVAIFDEGHFVI